MALNDKVAFTNKGETKTGFIVSTIGDDAYKVLEDNTNQYHIVPKEAILWGGFENPVTPEPFLGEERKLPDLEQTYEGLGIEMNYQYGDMQPIYDGVQLNWYIPTKVKFTKLHPDAQAPVTKDGNAGYDLHSVEDVTIEPGQRVTVKTGLAVAIPTGYVALLWDRSGMSAKHGIHRVAGVIDETYRGEWMVALVNLSDEKYEIKKGDRIVQALIQVYNKFEWEEVDSLDETERGEGGFGSSGK